MTIQLGILLALLCAFASNLAFFYKHRGACAVPQVSIAHPLRSAADLWRSKWFAIGMLVGLGAWLLHVAALSLAPLSMVQAVVAGGVAMIAVMADRMFGFQVGRRQWWGLGLTTAGLVLLAITLPRTGGSHDSFTVASMISFQGVLLGVGGLLIIGPRAAGAHEKHHGVALAAASGVLFGVCNVAVKALSGMVGDAGIMALVSPWTAVGLVGQAIAFLLVITASALTPAPRAATGPSAAPVPAAA
jgi:drug/metabolite transporter (DMT)-like permease